MKPLDFYRFGMSLSETADAEAAQRTAVSRLYYGLHHEACCRYFRTNPASGPLNGNRRHVDLRDRYNSPDAPKSRTVGRLLNDLRMLRSQADYELVPPLRFRNRSLDPRQFLSLAVETARQLLDALDDYSPGEAEDGCKCPQAFMSG